MADFNLLPWRERHQQVCQQQLMLGVVAACVLAACVIFGAEIELSQRLTAQFAQHAEWQTQLAAQAPALERLQKRRAERQQLAAYWQALQPLIKAQTTQRTFLHNLAAHWPPELSLSLLQQEEKERWWLEGTAPTAAALTAWLQTFSRLASVPPRVHLEGVRAESATQRQHFRLSVQLDASGAPAP